MSVGSCAGRRMDDHHESDAVDDDNDEKAAEALKEKVQRQEIALKNSLASRLASVHEETVTLQRIKRELESMTFSQRKDIDIIRGKIEAVSRNLSTATNDMRQKKAELDAAEAEVERLTKAKNRLVEHLHVIVHDNEKKKEAKLQELMKQAGLQSEGDPSTEVTWKGFD